MKGDQSNTLANRLENTSHSMPTAAHMFTICHMHVSQNLGRHLTTENQELLIVSALDQSASSIERNGRATLHFRVRSGLMHKWQRPIVNLEGHCPPRAASLPTKENRAKTHKTNVCVGPMENYKLAPKRDRIVFPY